MAQCSLLSKGQTSVQAVPHIPCLSQNPKSRDEKKVGGVTTEFEIDLIFALNQFVKTIFEGIRSDWFFENENVLWFDVAMNKIEFLR